MTAQDSLKKKYGRTAEERLLGARLLEAAQKAGQRGTVFQSDFLSPAERAFCLSIAEIPKHCTLTFDGGYPEAERTVAVFTPKTENPAPAKLAALALNYKGEPLGHRDLLGALMVLGIRREKIGDIIASTLPPVLICGESVAQIIVRQLDRAGRNRIAAVPCLLESVPPPKTESITGTVMSLRLDSIVAEGFRMSRGAAAEAIEKGLVTLNWKICDSVSKGIEAEDRIALRGSGVMRVEELGGQSRKGRIFVRIARYL